MDTGALVGNVSPVLERLPTESKREDGGGVHAQTALLNSLHFTGDAELRAPSSPCYFPDNTAIMLFQ